MNKAEKTFDPRLKLPLAPQFADYMAGKKIYPVSIEISPCGYCNATCSFCWYAEGAAGSHRKVELKKDRLRQLLFECGMLGIRSITWTGGGEPTLYGWFDQVITWAAELGIKQGLFTNALRVPKYNPTLLEWVRVTMTDRPFNVEAIRLLRTCKTLGIAFNYAGPQDDDYLRQTLELADEVKADYVQLRPALAFGGKTVYIKPPKIEHPLLFVTRYKFEESNRRHPYKECEGYHFTPFLWEDGNLDVCAYNRMYPGYTLGNIYQDSLQQILDAAPAVVPVHDGCQVCCKLHETNLLIHESRAVSDKEFP